MEWRASLVAVQADPVDIECPGGQLHGGPPRVGVAQCHGAALGRGQGQGQDHRGAALAWREGSVCIVHSIG